MSSAASSLPMPGADLPRLLGGLRRDGSPLRLDAHLAVHGRQPSSAHLIDLVSASGLRGRGGGGYGQPCVGGTGAPGLVVIEY